MASAPQIDVRFSFQQDMQAMWMRPLGAMLPFLQAHGLTLNEEQWHSVCSQMFVWGNPCVKGGKPDPRWQEFATKTYGANFRKTGGRTSAPKAEASPGKKHLLNTCFHPSRFGRVKLLKSCPGDIPFLARVAAGKAKERVFWWPVDQDCQALTGEALEAYTAEHFKCLDSAADLKRGFIVDGEPAKLRDFMPAGHWFYVNEGHGTIAPKWVLDIYKMVESGKATKSSRFAGGGGPSVSFKEPPVSAEDKILALLSKPEDTPPPDPRPAAAVKIQALIRRFLTRSRYLISWGEREAQLTAIIKRSAVYVAQAMVASIKDPKAKAAKRAKTLAAATDQITLLLQQHSAWWVWNVARQLRGGIPTKGLSRCTDLWGPKGLCSYYKMDPALAFKGAWVAGGMPGAPKPEFILQHSSALSNSFRKHFASAAAAIKQEAEEEEEMIDEFDA